MLRKDVAWDVAYVPADHASHKPTAQLHFTSKVDRNVFFTYTFGSGFCAFRNSIVAVGTGTGQLIAEEGRYGRHLGFNVPDRVVVAEHWVFLHNDNRNGNGNGSKTTMLDLVERTVVDLEPSKEGLANARRLPDGQWYTVLKERKLFLALHENPEPKPLPDTACSV